LVELYKRLRFKGWWQFTPTLEVALRLSKLRKGGVQSVPQLAESSISQEQARRTSFSSKIATGFLELMVPIFLKLNKKLTILSIAN